MKRAVVAGLSVVILFLVGCTGGESEVASVASSIPTSATTEAPTDRWSHLGPDEYEAKSTADPGQTTSAAIEPEPVVEQPEVAEQPLTPATGATDSNQTKEPVGAIWSEPGVGYQCAGTDAWVHDPANCTAANLGGETSYDTMWGPEAAIPAEEAMRDPSTVPYSEGGTCPAYLCGYGTDAEGNDLNAVREESHRWWAECVAANSTEYCRANDPYQ